MTKQYKHVVHGMQVKGNCFACEFLSEGVVSNKCKKRHQGNLNRAEENAANDHWSKMQDRVYLCRAKRCCEIKKAWLK